MLQIITTKEELQETINTAVAEALKQAGINQTASTSDKQSDDTIISGVDGLAKFLECSYTTAHNLKKKKLFPVYQSGRIIKFKKSEVIDGLKKTETKHTR